MHFHVASSQGALKILEMRYISVKPLRQCPCQICHTIWPRCQLGEASQKHQKQYKQHLAHFSHRKPPTPLTLSHYEPSSRQMPHNVFPGYLQMSGSHTDIRYQHRSLAIHPCRGEAQRCCMPCTSDLQWPLHGLVPLCSRELRWQDSALLGDSLGEAKGDLGRGGNGWNMLGPEPALGMCITWQLALPSIPQSITAGLEHIPCGLFGCHPVGSWLIGGNALRRWQT